MFVRPTPAGLLEPRSFQEQSVPWTIQGIGHPGLAHSFESKGSPCISRPYRVLPQVRAGLCKHCFSPYDLAMQRCFSTDPSLTRWFRQTETSHDDNPYSCSSRFRITIRPGNRCVRHRHGSCSALRNAVMPLPFLVSYFASECNMLPPMSENCMPSRPPCENGDSTSLGTNSQSSPIIGASENWCPKLFKRLNNNSIWPNYWALIMISNIKQGSQTLLQTPCHVLICHLLVLTSSYLCLISL